MCVCLRKKEKKASAHVESISKLKITPIISMNYHMLLKKVGYMACGKAKSGECSGITLYICCYEIHKLETCEHKRAVNMLPFTEQLLETYIPFIQIAIRYYCKENHVVFNLNANINHSELRIYDVSLKMSHHFLSFFKYQQYKYLIQMFMVNKRILVSYKLILEKK